jgi:two-component system sensor histidine kinase KdpD
MRTALLAAVSHDLRTPLASAKAAVTSLRSDEVEFSPEDRDELLATADESLDRLDRLVANLLDMSRLQAGVLGVSAIDIAVDDVVSRALGELGDPARGDRGRRPGGPARRARRPGARGAGAGERRRERPFATVRRTGRRW